MTPRPRKKKTEQKSEDKPPKRYNECECGSLRTGFNEIAAGQARLYYCLTCSKTWEVSMQEVNSEYGF